MTTQDGEVILIAPWWLSQAWFPHLLRLCVDHPLFIPYCRDLLSQQRKAQTAIRTICMDGGSHAALRPSSKIFKKVDSQQLLEGPLQTEFYDDRWLHFAHWTAGQGIDPLGPTAAQLAAFL